MEIATADRERFLEAFKWYQWCCDQTDRARSGLRFATPLWPEAEPAADIGEWDPDRARRIAAMQQALATAHGEFARTLNQQAEALLKTTAIAEEIVIKLKAQDER